MAIPFVIDTGVGTYLPQEGPTYGAKIYVNGDLNVPQPTSVKYIPPKLAFKTLKGKPIYQGLPQLELHWDHMDINGFQALSVAFFTNLNLEDGPVVDVIWPSPYEAGRFLEARAYMEWPTWDEWSQLYLNGVTITLSSFSLKGQGIFF
jgi:hypothetical protein